jgi:hypothetical protein
MMNTAQAVAGAAGREGREGRAQIGASGKWTMCDELRSLTGLLITSNLVLVEARQEALSTLLRGMEKAAEQPGELVAACASVLGLPFMRMSKKTRLNRLYEPFVKRARELNCAVLKAKVAAARKLGEMCRSETLSGAVVRLAAATLSRVKVAVLDFGELNDREIPARMLPPKREEGEEQHRVEGAGGTAVSERALAAMTTLGAEVMEGVELEGVTVKVPVGGLGRKGREVSGESREAS